MLAEQHDLNHAARSHELNRERNMTPTHHRSPPSVLPEVTSQLKEGGEVAHSDTPETRAVSGSAGAVGGSVPCSRAFQSSSSSSSLLFVLLPWDRNVLFILFPDWKYFSFFKTCPGIVTRCEHLVTNSEPFRLQLPSWCSPGAVWNYAT